MIKGSCPFPAIGWERAAFALSGNPNHSSDLLHKDNLLPPPAKRGIMRNEFRQPDEQNMRQLLHQHPEDLPGLILRLAWLQGLSREEIVALKWAQVDFQERSLFLEDRTVPLEEETAGCLAARFENGGAVSPYVVISDKFREPLRPESVSRIARNALTAGGLPQLQLKDLRRDYFFRQLEQHDWPYAVRVSGLSVSTFQACFAGDTPHKKRSTQAGQQFDEFRLWQVLQKEDSSAAGIALWMSWQMGVQGKELVNLTWDQVDLERGLLHLPERDMLLTNAVRRLLEKVQKVRSPGEDPHVLLSPQSRRPMDLARLSKVVQTALIRGGLENITLRDIRAAGGQREDDQTLLEHHPAGCDGAAESVGHCGISPPSPAGWPAGAGAGGQEILSPRNSGAGGKAVGGDLSLSAGGGVCLLPGCSGAPARRKAQDGRYPAADGEGRPAAAV